MEMMIDGIINRLGSLRANSADLARADDAERPWQNDVDACDAAINSLFALTEEGDKTADAARDLVYDYRALSKQYRALHLRHEVAEKPVFKNGAWHCPACGRRIDPRHSFCHWCGKKLNAGGRNRS